MFISPDTRVLKSRLRYFVSDLPKLLYLGPRFSLGHFTLLAPSDSEWLSLLLSLCLRLWRRLFLFDLVFCLPVSLMCLADGSSDSAELKSDGSSTSPSAASALSALKSAIVGTLLFTLLAAESPATAVALVLEFPAVPPMHCPHCKAEISVGIPTVSADAPCPTAFLQPASQASPPTCLNPWQSPPWPVPTRFRHPASPFHLLPRLPPGMELSLRSVLRNSLAFWQLGHKIAAGTYGAKTRNSNNVSRSVSTPAMLNFAAEYFVVTSSSVSMHRLGLDQSPDLSQNKYDGNLNFSYPFSW